MHKIIVIVSFIATSFLVNANTNGKSGKKSIKAKSSKSQKKLRRKKKKIKYNYDGIIISQQTYTILRVIDEELRTLKQRFKKTIRRNPRMMFRLSELFFEKAKVIKNEENNRFLKLSIKEKQKIKREVFFKLSRKYLQIAQKQGIEVLKLTNDPEIVAEINLILAYNAREFNQMEQARDFFFRAMEYSPPGSRVHQKAQVALAEYFYNENEYGKAIALYEKSLRFDKYRWWTKDAMNLAWCYYNEKQYKKAIKLTQVIYQKSLNTEMYIDISEHALKNITLFFATSKRINQAVAYFKEIGESISENMLEMSKILIQREMMATAITVLAKAYVHAESREIKVDVQITRLKVYEKFGRVAKHFKVSRDLFKMHKQKKIENQSLTDYKEQMLTMAGRLQKQLVKTEYTGVEKLMVKKTKIAAKYFRMLSLVDDVKSVEYNFLEGETWHLIDRYSMSLKMYYTGLSKCKKKPCNKEIQDKIINSSLATLGNENISKKTYRRYLVPTYEVILDIEPVSPRSQKIYVKLFNAYLSKNKLVKAENLIKTYQKHYTNDHPTLEGMVARILEGYRKRKDIPKLMVWAERIHANEFIVSNKYKLGLYKTLAAMRLAKVQKSLSTGNKREALKAYIKVFKYKLTPFEEKKQTAYNISLLFFELGWMKRTKSWMMAALNIQGAVEIKKYAPTYMTIIYDFFQRRKLDNSIEISEFLINKMCNEKFKYKTALWKNINSLSLAQKDYSKYKASFAILDKCKIPFKEVFTLIHTQVDFLKSDMDNYQFVINQLLRMKPSLGKKEQSEVDALNLNYRYEHSIKSGSGHPTKEYLALKGDAEAKGIPLSHEIINDLAKDKYLAFENSFKVLTTIKLQFPQEVFNDRLQKIITQLEKITDDGNYVLKVGSGDYNLKVYRSLMLAYNYAIKEFREFDPPEKDPNFRKSFKESMNSLIVPLSAKAREFFGHAKKLIAKDGLYSDESFWFHSYNKFPIGPIYAYPRDGVLTDRLGSGK